MTVNGGLQFDQRVSIIGYEREGSAVEQKWYVYILRCADGTLYTGITNHPERRLKAHNAGTASKYTRARRPVTMVYREDADSKGDALRREFAIKAMTRAQKRLLFEQDEK